MSDTPDDDAASRLRELSDFGRPRLVATPRWVKPLGALLVVGLIVVSVLAAIQANPW